MKQDYFVYLKHHVVIDNSEHVAIFVCDSSRDSIEIEFQLDFLFTLQKERWINVCVFDVSTTVS